MSASFYLRRGVLSALATALSLIGGMLVGGVAGSVIHDGLPGHLRESARIGVAALFALAGLFAGGALWGAAMARIARVGEDKRMALAGALGFGLTSIVMGLVLTVLEGTVVAPDQVPRFPIHVVFPLLFVPATALVAGVSGYALGLALRNHALAVRLAWSAGLTGGAAFLVVNQLLDVLGWRVGAPGAAERATMLTVMFAGDVVAALAGGAIIGLLLSHPVPRTLLASESV